MEKGEHQGGTSTSSSQQQQQQQQRGGGSGKPRSGRSASRGGGRGGRGRSSVAGGRGRGGRHHHNHPHTSKNDDPSRQETETKPPHNNHHHEESAAPSKHKQLQNGYVDDHNSATATTSTNTSANESSAAAGRGRGRGGRTSFTGRGGGRGRGRSHNRTTGRHSASARGGGRGHAANGHSNGHSGDGGGGDKLATENDPFESTAHVEMDTATTTTTTTTTRNNDNNNTQHAETEEHHTHHREKGGRFSSRGGRGRGRGRHEGRGGGRGGRGPKPLFHKHKKNHPGHNDEEAEQQPHNGVEASPEIVAEVIPKEQVPNGVQHQTLSATKTETTNDNTAESPTATKEEIVQPTELQAESQSPTTQPTLSLPKPPMVKGGKGGGPMILMRKNHDNHSNLNSNTEEEKKMADEQADPNAVTAVAAVVSRPGKEKKKKKNPKGRGGKKKKKDRHEDDDDDDDDEEPEDEEDPAKEKAPSETATQALQSLPAQEVSITASTKVKLKSAGNSSASLSKLAEEKSPAKSSKKSKSKKIDSTKAARKFNNDVRMCVERSDPETMKAILRNKKNHQYALEAIVLETVMKAYLMAAMFDDALYCLRNCALPGTLSTLQTERILTCLPQNLRNSSAYTAADMINALCMATEFDTPTSRTYFLRIVRGIALEFLEEATSARDRICSAPCERLVRSGVCVVDARLKRGKKATELVVMPGEQLGVFVPDSMENRGIQAGDAVSILPYAGPYPMSAESLDRNMIEGTVINTNPMVLRLQDKTNAALHSMLTEQVEGNVYRVDKLANRMGFNRQLSAAVAVASPFDPDMAGRDNRRPCPQLIQAITAMDENIDRVMKQPGGFGKTGQLTSTAALCSEAIPWSYQDESEDLTQDEVRQTSQLAIEKYNALEGLNLSQRLAVEGATTNRLTLIQGPPGTGKTAVAIRILQHWARLAKSTPGEAHYPILATSDSNIAVDNLVEGCAAVGLSVVRLGRPEAIRPELLRYCIDRPPSSYGSNGQSYTSNSAFKERIKTLKNAQVICCTCIGSGGDILDAMTFDRILVDEATQATEPAVLVPLMRGCRQLVLVGDHCQLPPTVLSTRAEEEGHGVPLFSRMVACGVPPFMLDTQYRMHPCIAMFPSDLFYGGKLQNGVTAPERRPLAGFPWPREEFPVAYIPVQGIEMDDGVSKYNELEAEAACRAVQALLEGGQCTVSDIAVCTPYAAQARLIRRMTRRLVTTGPPYIEVSSVDGFQGREKEAVVFSAVRSNDYGAIGFTSDWRRVNVSFTRARRALIVIGNDVTLRRGDPDTWMPWLAWADAHGLNMDHPGICRGRYEPEQLRRVRGGTTAAEMLRDVLERQQAQLKSAQDKFDKAQKVTAGHFRGGESTTTETFNGVISGEGSNAGDKALSLEEDLARLENADGHWDDTDDEDHGEMHHSTSQPTLTSAASSNRLTSDDGSETPTDAWDL